MKIIDSKFDEVKLLQPTVYSDERGFFFESYNARVLREMLGLTKDFVQDNHSHSVKNVLRGMHYQIGQPQGKLVRVAIGRVFDVVVDMRRNSPTFKQWQGIELSDTNHQELWIPPGFAHGFLVLSDFVDFLYKTTDFYAPETERCLIWNDPDIGIEWPCATPPILSPKYAKGLAFANCDTY